MRTIVLSLFLLISQFATVRAEVKGDWVSDYEVATKLAAEQKRRIFVLFTNSKVCAPCHIFKEAILSKQEFADYAAKNLILLQVDYAPYHNKENHKDLDEIEAEKKIPKELWMHGRGPWPYLFVLSPTKEVLYSGKAGDPSREKVDDYLKFLDGLGK